MTRRHIPNSDRLVVRSRDDLAAILRECDRRHRICVALQLSLHLARRDIPNSDRFVVRSRDDSAAILRECDRHTQSVWPFSSASTLPVVTFQIRTVLSNDPETTRLPSCENATDDHPICVALQLSLDLARRHIPNSDRLSNDPETTRLPSCENATDITKLCVALQLSLHLARRDIPNSDRFVV
jgi:hypothetical protein